MSHAFGIGSGPFASVLLGDARLVLSGVDRTYYDAYGRYLRVVENIVGRIGESGGKLDRVGECLQGVVPPVWGGCVAGVAREMSVPGESGGGAGHVVLVSQLGEIGEFARSGVVEANVCATGGGSGQVRCFDSGVDKICGDVQGAGAVGGDSGVVRGGIQVSGFVGNGEEVFSTVGDAGERLRVAGVVSEGGSREERLNCTTGSAFGAGDGGDDGAKPVEVVDLGEGESAGSKQYQKNCVRRLKKKQRKLRRAGDCVPGGSPVPQWRRGAGPVTAPVSQSYFADLPDDVQRKLKETRAQLLIEKNKRELLEEQSKLRYLESPMAAVNEAMRALGVVERIAKKENAGKILEWASKASESYASSVSGVASEGLSGSGVSANSSVSIAEKRVAREWGLRKAPASAPERILLVNGVLSTEDLVVARGRVGRKLNSLDVLRKDAPFGLTAALRYEIERSEERVCPNDIYL